MAQACAYVPDAIVGTAELSGQIVRDGGSLSFDYRFSDYVGLVVQATGPFPVADCYLTTLFHVGLGVSGYLL